jgi:NAD/NADP transhydrogenase beta subunit
LRLQPTSLRQRAFIVAIVVASGAVWLTGWQLAQSILDFTVLRTSVTLVYIPAGVRLVILLVAGIWGALGIILAFPFALIQVFPDVTWPEVAAYSVIAGLIPYATVLATCRVAGVSRDLGTLRSIHLPLLAAAVSLTGALTYAGALVAFGRFDTESFLPDATAMAAGDFLGCFAVVALVRLAVAWHRKRR